MKEITLTDAQVLAIAETLKRIVTDDDVKVAWGMAKRRELQEAISRGQQPDNYRIDWLISTRSAIIDTLAREAVVFNDRYRHDRITSRDMMDVIASTMAQFQMAIAQIVKGSAQND